METLQLDETLPPRSSLGQATYLALLGITIGTIPYLIPVPPSVSMSYVTGYSNRAALVIFLLGGLSFVMWTRGRIASTDEGDQRLSVFVLVLSLALVVAACLGRINLSMHKLPADEALFFIDRQQLLVAGAAPYTQFDFPYGPLLLYPGYWISHVFHITQTNGYYSWWCIEWVAGTVMMWVVVRSIDFAVAKRRALYLLLFALQLGALACQGSNYTPFRAFSSAFFICVSVLYLQKKTRSPAATAIAGVLAVMCVSCISPEQCLATAVGFAVYFFLIAKCGTHASSWLSFALYILGCALCFSFEVHHSMFVTMRAFSSGGNSLPIIPSPSQLLTLFAYVCTGCALYRALAERGQKSLVTPLSVAGFAMLPAAMGRADLIHLYSATPIFCVGVAFLCTLPAVRRWWMPLAFLGLFLIPNGIGLQAPVAKRVHRLFPGLKQGATAAPEPASTGLNQAIPPSELMVPFSSLPCDRTYFAPTFLPSPLHGYDTRCLQRSYYYELVNAVTKEAIEREIAQLRQHEADPLLLSNAPLGDQFPTREINLKSLQLLELSPIYPRVRNPPLTYAPIISYIEGHYRPGSVVANGRLRIWEPVR